MTTLVSYNILAGGYSMRAHGTRRTLQLINIIRSAHPDIVGVVEATHPLMQQHPLVIEEIAAELKMQLIMGGSARHGVDYQTALLTRLPVIHTQLHRHPNLNKALLEVRVEQANGQQITVFVTHLSAAFNRGRAGGAIRQREVEAILHIMAPLRAQGLPHIIMGDFNSLAPGDRFRASSLVNYVLDLDREERDSTLADGHPHLSFVVPPELRFLNPILRIIPRNQLVSTLFNVAAALYAPRGCIRLLLDAGYMDSYRRIHPHTLGFTCPAAAPAGRIDFIFASPEMAACLETCYILTEGEGTAGDKASDHLAVAAELSQYPLTNQQHEEESRFAPESVVAEPALNTSH